MQICYKGTKGKWRYAQGPKGNEDMQAPVTQLMRPKGNGDMQAAKRKAVDRFKRCGRF